MSHTRAGLARGICQTGYALLLLVMLIGTLTGDSTGGASIGIVLAVKLVPLLLVLPGLIRDNLRSYVWLCFIDLFYFTRATVDTVLLPGHWQHLLPLTLSVLVFCSALLYIKWEKADGRTI
jgi:uncharacterized membrane protein